MVLLFQCKYRCVKLNMLKLAPKTEQDSNGTFHQGAFFAAQMAARPFESPHLF